MKLQIDPMPALRASATERLNAHYANRVVVSAQRALAHRRKAEQAAAVVGGKSAPAAFASEAELRGMNVTDFAALVLSKSADSDALDALELERQRRLLAIEAAATPAGLDDVMKMPTA